MTRNQITKKRSPPSALALRKQSLKLGKRLHLAAEKRLRTLIPRPQRKRPGVVNGPQPNESGLVRYSEVELTLCIRSCRRPPATEAGAIKSAAPPLVTLRRSGVRSQPGLNSV
jgi:hypothetical protein